MLSCRVSKRAGEENSYLLTRRYQGYSNEVAIAMSRQDISVPIGRWVGQVEAGVVEGVGMAGAGLLGTGAAVGSIPGNIASTFTAGLGGLFG